MDDDEEQFWFACNNSNWTMVKRYIEEGLVDVSQQSDFAFRCALRDLNLEMMQYLVGQGANVYPARIAIRHAAEEGRLDVIKYLVSQGVDPTQVHPLPLRYAVSNGHLHVVKYLVSKGLDPDSVGHMCVLYAVIGGYWDVVDYFVKEKGQDIFAKCQRSDISYLCFNSINAFLRLFHSCKNDRYPADRIMSPEYPVRILMLVNVMKGTIAVDPDVNDGEKWKDSVYYDSNLGMLICSYID